MEERRTYTYRLAREGTPEAIAVLIKVFHAALPEDRAFMAQLIGSTRNPCVKDLLWRLLDDANQKVVLAALRGLCAIGGADVSTRLGILLADSGQPGLVRIETARGGSVIWGHPPKGTSWSGFFLRKGRLMSAWRF